MNDFGTFSKRITCRYWLMTWHILYFVYCIGYGAWAVSYCQEAGPSATVRAGQDG